MVADSYLEHDVPPSVIANQQPKPTYRWVLLDAIRLWLVYFRIVSQQRHGRKASKWWAIRTLLHAKTPTGDRGLNDNAQSPVITSVFMTAHHHFVTRTRLVAHYVTVCLAVAACTGATEPQAIAGTYELRTIDGRPLPTTLDGTPCGTKYQSAQIVFTHDGRVTLRRQWKSNGCGGAYGLEQIAGHFRATATQVDVTFAPPYDGLSADAGRGDISPDGRRIDIPLREAGMTAPPLAVFRFER